MSNTELKPCPFCCVTPVMATVGRDWVRLKTQCDDACLLHDKEFDYSLSDENRQTLINDWNQREPQDNWIPIEDRSKLKDSKYYSIQLKNGDVIFVEYLDHAGCSVDAGFIGLKNYYELDSVLFYQPLPEAKK